MGRGSRMIRRAWKILREEGLGNFIRKVLWFLDKKTGIVSFLLAPYVAYKARRLDLNKLLNELFNDKSLLSTLYRPMQVRWEMERLLEILRNLKPRYILEIGTAEGGTLFIWTRITSEDALLISVDLPRGSFGGGYPFLKGLTYKFFARRRQKIVLIRDDSHSVKTFRKVYRLLNGRKLDFLFIDGDHTYEGIKKDFEMYSPLVREGGIIALHDIVPGPSELVGGVPRFWAELRDKALSKNLCEIIEFVKSRNQGGYGIGILVKGNKC